MDILVELDPAFCPNFFLPVAVACILILFPLRSNPDWIDIEVLLGSDPKQCKADTSRVLEGKEDNVMNCFKSC